MGLGSGACGVLLADQATWRDLLWTTVDICVGWVLTRTPAGLIAWGLSGVVMPAVDAGTRPVRRALAAGARLIRTRFRLHVADINRRAP